MFNPFIILVSQDDRNYDYFILNKLYRWVGIWPKI